MCSGCEGPTIQRPSVVCIVTVQVSKLAEQGLKAVTPQEGDNMAAQIDAVRYIECSAKTQVPHSPI